MTPGDHADEGGEAPCFAHMLDQPPAADALLSDVVRHLADAVVIADADATDGVCPSPSRSPCCAVPRNGSPT